MRACPVDSYRRKPLHSEKQELTARKLLANGGYSWQDIALLLYRCVTTGYFAIPRLLDLQPILLARVRQPKISRRAGFAKLEAQEVFVPAGRCLR